MRDAFHAFDVLGNIAITKFSKDVKIKEKKKFASKILADNSSIKTVLEKTGKFSGRLRKQKTKYLAGENTKEVLYRENNCAFRFNMDDTYFSPRLSNERKEIAEKIKKGETVLVMFAGVAPFSIAIAKNSPAKKVFSNEINRKANEYAEMNIRLNKVHDKVELVQGDIKRLVKDGKIKQKFDVIVMPRPQLKDSFLKEAFTLSKKGTRIYYYDFCMDDKVNSVVDKIKEEAKKNRKKIKILETKKAGELAPHKIRLRVDFRIL
jgi:tRNA (guanine37-N1)-methyltransferase